LCGCGERVYSTPEEGTARPPRVEQPAATVTPPRHAEVDRPPAIEPFERVRPDFKDSQGSLDSGGAYGRRMPDRR
ncbi:MAG TPA: hypothetical protein VIQ62_02850, partial [Burkholderiales bacterium]